MIASAALCLVICIVFILCIGGPLANVAEVFEFEVVRYLNTPSLLRHSLNYFDDQLLPHLRYLEWGFRFGGTLITPGIVGVILTALVLTIVTTVSQVIWSKFAIIS